MALFIFFKILPPFLIFSSFSNHFSKCVTFNYELLDNKNRLYIFPPSPFKPFLSFATNLFTNKLYIVEIVEHRNKKKRI